MLAFRYPWRRGKFGSPDELVRQPQGSEPEPVPNTEPPAVVIHTMPPEAPFVGFAKTVFSAVLLCKGLLQAVSRAERQPFHEQPPPATHYAYWRHLDS